MTSSNASQCPLCESPNHCTIAQNPQATNCWCQQVKIPSDLIDQAKQINAQKRCICQTCATTAHKLSTEIKST